MTTLFRILGVIFLGGGACLWADAQAPASAASVRVDVQMVSLSVADAARLVPDLQAPAKAEAAWTRLQTKMARGDAKLLAWPVLRMQDGRDATTEEAVEVRYPTEFDPPQGPTVFGPDPLIYPTWGPRAQTAFETRNIGAKVYVDARVEPGGEAMRLIVTSEYVHPPVFKTWHTQRSPMGIDGLAEQPIFRSAKVRTDLRVHRDRPVLLGVFIFQDPEPHAELHILRAQTTVRPVSIPALP
jgi:hypothetical protein